MTLGYSEANKHRSAAASKACGQGVVWSEEEMAGASPDRVRNKLMSKVLLRGRSLLSLNRTVKHHNLIGWGKKKGSTASQDLQTVNVSS